MSAARHCAPAGCDQQGRVNTRCTAYPVAEPVQLAPAECGTDVGADDGPWESADREVLRRLSVGCLKLAVALGVSLAVIQGGLAVGAWLAGRP